MGGPLPFSVSMKLFPFLKPTSPEKMGRIISMMALPLMAVVIVLASRAVGTSAQVRTPPDRGLLVVANLRGESLTLVDLSGATGTRTLQVGGPPHEMVAVEGRVYATIGRLDRLIEVDPRAPGLLRALALAGEPHGIAADGSSLLVTLDKANAVAVIDRDGLIEESRRTTGETPHAIATFGPEAYVTASRANRLAAQHAGGATAATGKLPESVAVVGGYVVTANAGDGTLSVFTKDKLVLVGTVKLGGSPVRVIALDDAHVAVSLGSSAEVVVVDIARFRIDRRQKVGSRPDGLCLSPSRDYIAVVSNGDDLARVFRLPTWTPVMALVTGDGPGACLWLD